MTDVKNLRDDELVLMHHDDTDAWFECPAAAVDAWRARGWEVADPEDRPAEPNPAVQERIGFEAQHAESAAEESDEGPAAAAAKKSAKRVTKSTTPAPRGDEEKE